MRGAEIQTGDRVLIKIVTFDGRHTISDEPYIVLDQPGLNIPVFRYHERNNKR